MAGTRVVVSIMFERKNDVRYVVMKRKESRKNITEKKDPYGVA